MAQRRTGVAATRPAARWSPRSSPLTFPTPGGSAASKVEVELVQLRLRLIAQELEVVVFRLDVRRREDERIGLRPRIKLLDLGVRALHRTDVVDVILDLGRDHRVIYEIDHQRGRV